MKEYKIISRWEEDDETGEKLYWNNQFGWVPRYDADKFDETESKELRLPLGGEWEEQ